MLQRRETVFHFLRNLKKKLRRNFFQNVYTKTAIWTKKIIKNNYFCFSQTFPRNNDKGCSNLMSCLPCSIERQAHVWIRTLKKKLSRSLPVLCEVQNMTFTHKENFVFDFLQIELKIFHQRKHRIPHIKFKNSKLQQGSTDRMREL